MDVETLQDERGPTRTVRVGPLSDRVYDALRDRIVNGVYGADEKLPGEYDLAASFDVSRPIVREALERLRSEGLIYSRRGAGSFARRAQQSPTQPGFPPVETIADIQRCYEFRLAIEPDAARFAALRRNDDAMTRLDAALALLEDATRELRHREDADFAFHLAVARASNNHYHASALQALRDHVAVGMKMHGLSLLGPVQGLTRVFDEHIGIAAAIREGDADAAATRMREHLAGSIERLFGGRLLDLAM